MNNIVQLPRPTAVRPTAALGLHLRVGHQQHKDLQEVLASGSRNFNGITIDAMHAARHKSVRDHALSLGLDVALDPKTHAMAFPGSHKANMAQLPWGSDKPHSVIDFEGDAGREKSIQIAEFAQAGGFTQVLSPTHILGGANDRWLRRDIENTENLRLARDQSGADYQIIYPLVIQMALLKDSVQRDAIINALMDAPMDVLSLRIENFGSDATGEKTAAYITAARDFHRLGVPIIADFVGGLSGLSLLAFGAVGGISHGITLLEGFKASAWRNPPKEGRQSGGMATRVYIPQLDMLLKPAQAREFLDSSRSVKGHYGCTNTHCCPGGIRDMFDNPMKHFIYQRSQQVSDIAARPESARAPDFLDRHIRQTSDDISSAVTTKGLSDDISKKFTKQQKRMSKFRQVMRHQLEADSIPSIAQAPLRRAQRQNKT